VSVGLIADPDGTPQFASQGVTVSRTATGQYTISIAPGIFTQIAIPMFTPLNGAVTAGMSTNGSTIVNVTFVNSSGAAIDAFFHFTMVQVRP
jgi:hypothetical protein